MSRFKFILQPYSNVKNSRHTCPNCAKRYQFTLYIDAEKLEPINKAVGICNRQSKCGYHYTPKQYFQDNQYSATSIKPFPTDNQPYNKPVATNHQKQSKPLAPLILLPNKHHQTENNQLEQPISLIPTEIFKQSRKYYEYNNFTHFLERAFGLEIRNKLITLYHIGTSKKWPGATVFWQIDQHAKVRTGKIMLYNAETGKRVKKPYNHFYWAHKSLGTELFHLRQCLFGEHLLPLFPNKPVAIVESEKTAIICSVYLPKFVWLAVGGLSMLTTERCAALKARNVTLFPDLNGYEKWHTKSKCLIDIVDVKVSNILQTLANQKQTEQGLDLADFLLKLDVKQLKNHPVKAYSV